MPRDPNLFISHKHTDRQIADVIRKFVEKEGRREVSVFQSSSAQAQNPELGRALSTELKDALWRAGVVVLVYTTTDQDWQYCMWECGVATKRDSPDTRIIVLQCSPERPRVFTDQVSVDARDLEDVQKFVRDFLTDARFFPGYERAVAPRFAPDGPEVKQAAAELFTALKDVLPRVEVAEWPAQPLLCLQLPLTTIDTLTANAAPPADADSLVTQSATVSTIDQQARQLFGKVEVAPGLAFKDFLARWALQNAGAPVEWSTDIVQQIIRAARGEIPALRWVYLRAADGNARYAPALTRVRRLPALQAMQFDISLLPYDTLMATPASARMIDREGMTCVDLDETPMNQVRLAELADRFDEQRLSRIPFLEAEGRIRMIVHRSMIDRYLARKARHTGGVPIADLTLAHLVADEPEMKRVFENGFDTVGRHARLAEVRARMAVNRDCQDVFVTETGARDEPVLGWITNVMIAQTQVA